MALTFRVAVVLALLVGPSSAGDSIQTDWSLGGGEPAPVAAWTGSFEASADISWHSIPGQLALSSSPLATPIAHNIAEEHYGAYGLYVFDMDADGDQDVIGTTDTSSQVIIWRNQGGDPVTWIEEVVDDDFPGGTSVHPVDLDQDGDIDIVAAAQTPGHTVAWYRNDGGDPTTWTRQMVGPVPVACNVFAGDVDGDGDIDVLSPSWTGKFIAWYRNDGGEPMTWTRVKLDTDFSGAHSAVAGDMDADGDLDVVATAAQDNEVTIFFNGGGDPVAWSSQVLSSAMGGVRYAAIGDLDGDHRLDVVAAAWDGQLVWWQNGGGDPVAWSQQTIDTALDGGHYVSLADLDGDGSDDVIAVGWEVDTIAWYRNLGGDPVTWTKHVVNGDFTKALTAFPGDLDGDGDLDVVGTSHELGSFQWWEVSDFVPAGRLDSAVLDLGEVPDEAWLDWSAVEPDETGLAVSIRASDDAGDLGDWSEPLVGPGAVEHADGRFLQYRLDLSTADSTVSPIVNEVSLTTAAAVDSCEPSETTMCLNQGRFRVEVEWTDFQDQTGMARVVSAGSADSGLFWFFNPANWEMLVKVLDGCGVNGYYWVYAAATTNVGYTLTVTDTATGSSGTWVNEVGVSSPAITDSEAFATCP